jgi:hypothetical protein
MTDKNGSKLEIGDVIYFAFKKLSKEVYIINNISRQPTWQPIEWAEIRNNHYGTMWQAGCDIEKLSDGKAMLWMLEN